MKNTDDSSRLSRILDLTSQELRFKFDRLRESLEHNGVVGQEGEKIVATFLRERLPASIGVTTGEILDAEGGRSRQTDIILYDAARTPMLFSGEENDTHVVPAEGVLAVIEVKTRLRSGDLETCLANCRSVKQRVRAAYFPEVNQVRHIAYGGEWDDLPIFYSVFGAAADNFYAERLNKLQSAVPVHERIDMLCYLDRGVSINVELDLSNGIEVAGNVISPRSLPKGGLANVETSKSLLIWYAMLASIVMQVGTRPIDITKYVSRELHVQAVLPDGPIAKTMFDDALAAMSEHQGIKLDTLRRWQAKEPLTLQDHYELMRAPGYSPPQDLTNLTEGQRDTLALAAQASRTMPFDAWAKLGLIVAESESSESKECDI